MSHGDSLFRTMTDSYSGPGKHKKHQARHTPAICLDNSVRNIQITEDENVIRICITATDKAVEIITSAGTKVRLSQSSENPK